MHVAHGRVAELYAADAPEFPEQPRQPHAAPRALSELGELGMRVPFGFGRRAVRFDFEKSGANGRLADEPPPIGEGSSVADILRLKNISPYHRPGDDRWWLHVSCAKLHYDFHEPAFAELRKSNKLIEEIHAQIVRRRCGVMSANEFRWLTEERKPLALHVEKFGAWLAAKGRTPERIAEAGLHLRRIAEWCGFQRISELDALGVQTAIGNQQIRRKWCAQTVNKYLKSAKQFSKWLRVQNLSGLDALISLENLNPEIDRCKLRALSWLEVTAVIAAAARGPKLRGMRGRDRATLYLLAACTGLRRKELASLTPQSFSLDADPPTILIRAADSKHRITDVQPIRPDLAEHMRAWLAARRPATRRGMRIGPPALADTRPLFQRLAGKRTCAMFKSDLAAAGIDYVNADGKAPFHSLRASYCTALAGNCDDVGALRNLMRHKELRTTQRYVRPHLSNEVRALSKMPGLPLADDDDSQAVQRATGTDPRPVDAQKSPEPADSQMALFRSPLPAIKPLKKRGICHPSTPDGGIALRGRRSQPAPAVAPDAANPAPGPTDPPTLFAPAVPAGDRKIQAPADPVDRDALRELLKQQQQIQRRLNALLGNTDEQHRANWGENHTNESEP